MEKCKCWVAYGPTGYCNGTKNLEQCMCDGDRCKCDFYSDIRAKALGTYEAELEAGIEKLQHLGVLDETGAVAENYREILRRK